MATHGPGCRQGVIDFFWHLVDSVPALDITSTLRRDEPPGYDDARVGVLVLVFEVVVIAPILATFVSFWRYRRKSPP